MTIVERLTQECDYCLTQSDHSLPSFDTGTRRKRGNIDTSNFNRQVTTLLEVSGHLSVKVRGINVASLSTSACVK
jgi:hypothetical protein